MLAQLASWFLGPSSAQMKGSAIEEVRVDPGITFNDNDQALGTGRIGSFERSSYSFRTSDPLRCQLKSGNRLRSRSASFLTPSDAPILDRRRRYHMLEAAIRCSLILLIFFSLSYTGSIPLSLIFSISLLGRRYGPKQPDESGGRNVHHAPSELRKVPKLTSKGDTFRNCSDRYASELLRTLRFWIDGSVPKTSCPQPRPARSFHIVVYYWGFTNGQSFFNSVFHRLWRRISDFFGQSCSDDALLRMSQPGLTNCQSRLRLGVQAPIIPNGRSSVSKGRK